MKNSKLKKKFFLGKKVVSQLDKNSTKEVKGGCTCTCCSCCCCCCPNDSLEVAD